MEDSKKLGVNRAACEKADKILNYWYEMEYFNPSWPVEVEKDINLTKKEIPWPKVVVDPEYRITFDVYMGKVKTDELIQWMIDKLEIKKEEKIEKDNSESCICALKVNENGIYVSGSFAISSFVWAVCELRKNGFESDLEKQNLEKLQESVNEILEGEENTEPTMVTTDSINKIFCYICEELSIGTEFRTFTRWAKEKKQKALKNNKGSNEVTFSPAGTSTELFSSYYLKDIQKVKNEPTKRTIKYICAMENQQKDELVEIDVNVSEMEKWTAPEKYPLGIWPSVYHPCLMQQIAINLAISKEQDIFSVNGPPGTGKTTLLKEIIVSNVIERSIAISKFISPNDAFTNQSFADPPDNFSKNYYVPNEAISSYGIIVASNNNAAVENISIELPKKINKDRSGRFLTNNTEIDNTYFSDIATGLLKEPAWGLISAKLGKRDNLKPFIEVLCGGKYKQPLSNYYDDIKRIPNWEEAKEKFNNALSCVNKSRSEICMIQDRFIKYNKLQNDIFELQKICLSSGEKVQIAAKKLIEVEDEIKKLQSLEVTKKKNIETLLGEIHFIKRWLWKLFKSNPLISKWKSLESEVEGIILEIINQQALLPEKAQLLSEAQLKHENNKKDLEKLQILNNKFYKEIDLYKIRFGNNIADNKFWEDIKENEPSQEAAPWTDTLYDSQREELFYHALMLHKAFILNSNPIKQNLKRLLYMWDDKFTQEDRKRAYGSLINTLQIVIPVISTTFASVEAFLGGIGAEELGLLIIDESGQATPQSALGAIWRTKRAIIVGDPLQVEPIVTTPKELQIRFGDKNKIAPDYRIPEISAQMIGDRINRYGGVRTLKGQQLWLGCPLVLHRRCLNPMFKISNEIAYNGRMFQKTVAPNSEISLSMEKSFWLDVKGKMCGEHNQNVDNQNNAAILLFEKALLSSKKLPNVYIISPFKKVAYEISNKVKAAINKHQLGITDSEIDTWAKAHCGTVHTFQGKEANEVILVLGCDSVTGDGAAKWVGSKPNIINVAVSRAKYRICIIGDYDQWIKIPYVNVACKHLDVKKTAQ